MASILELENLLVNTRLPISRYRRNVLQKGDTFYRGGTLGLVRHWYTRNFSFSMNLKRKKYDELFEKAVKLCNSTLPDFRFTTIQINESYKMAKHVDSNNGGVSAIIGVGDYTGGELLIYYDGPDKPPTPVDIKNKFFEFDGSKYYHEVAEFTGTRFTLVYYSCFPEDVSDYLIHGVRQPLGTKSHQFKY